MYNPTKIKQKNKRVIGLRKVELSPSWNYQDGDIGSSVAGVLINIERELGPWAQNYYIIKNIPIKYSWDITTTKENNGETLGIWGNKLLDRILKKVSIGEYIIINYLGKAKGQFGKKDYHYFEVFKYAGPINGTLSNKNWIRVL
jgi:hypothetical protein